jgi:hypothetical protein
MRLTVPTLQLIYPVSLYRLRMHKARMPIKKDIMAGLGIFSKNDEEGRIDDGVVRLGVVLFFGIFGMEKFSSSLGSHWVDLFHRIGLGNWFRYFTGVVEVLGALLVAIERTAVIGLAMLATTMLGAVLIVAFKMHAPADSLFPGVFLVALVIIGWFRLRR